MLMSSVQKLAKDVITSTEGQGHACMRTYHCRCMSVSRPDMVLVVVVQAACPQPACHKCPCGQVWDVDGLTPHLHKTCLRTREELSSRLYNGIRLIQGIQELEGLICTHLMPCTLAEGPAPEDTSRGTSWIRSLLDLQRWVLAESDKLASFKRCMKSFIDTMDCK